MKEIQKKKLFNMFIRKEYKEGLNIAKKLQENNLEDTLNKYKFIIEFQFELKEYKESIENCNKLIKLFIANSSIDIDTQYGIYQSRILSIINLGKYSLAISELDNLIYLFSNKNIQSYKKNIIFSDIFSLKARCLFKIKDYKSSIIFSDKSLKNNIKNYNSYFTMGLSYYLLGYNDKSEEYFNRLINRIDEKDHLQLFNAYMTKGMINLSTQKYDKSSRDFMNAVKNENDNSKDIFDSHINLSASLYFEEKFDDSLKFLEEASKVVDENDIKKMNFFKFNKGFVKAKKIDKLNNIKFPEEEYLSVIKLLKIGEKSNNDDFQEVIYDKANVYNAYLKHYNSINNIGNITRELFGVNLNISLNDLKNLIDLVRYVGKFMNSRKVVLSDMNNYFYQYTGKNILSSILDLKKSGDVFKLRLYNASYMNDSKEGYKLLLDINKNINNDVNNNFYNYFIDDSSNENISVDDIYISSLSQIDPFNDDSGMPLWNNYGDDHKGVGLSFNIYNKRVSTKNDVDNKYIEKNINNSENITSILGKSNFNYNKIYNNKLKTNVYRVVYSSDSDAKEMISKISYIFERLNNCINDKDVLEIVYKYLNKLRYLYKSSIYSYEKEVRIIKEEKDYDNLYYDKDNPKLYTNLTDDDGIAIDLKGITFGVNFDKPYLWYPLIFKKLGKNFNIKLSRMDYR